MDTGKNVLIALSLALASGAAAQDPDSEIAPQGGEQAQQADPSTSRAGTNAYTSKLNLDGAFRSLDANADRALSPDEARSSAELNGAFQSLDTDHSGSLSDAEFARFELGGAPADSPAPGDAVSEEGQPK